MSRDNWLEMQNPRIVIRQEDDTWASPAQKGIKGQVELDSKKELAEAAGISKNFLSDIGSEV